MNISAEKPTEPTFEYFASFAEAEAADRAHWFSKSPQERLAAAEQLRQIAYGYDATTARIQEVFEFVEPARG